MGTVQRDAAGGEPPTRCTSSGIPTLASAETGESWLSSLFRLTSRLLSSESHWELKRLMLGFTSRYLRYEHWRKDDVFVFLNGQ